MRFLSAARSIVRHLAGGDRELEQILFRIDAAASRRDPPERVTGLMCELKPEVSAILSRYFSSPIFCQALTLKLLNFCLARHHFFNHSTYVASQPVNLTIDPSNACNLGCPGCVHSAHSKNGNLFDWKPGLLREDRLRAFLLRYGPHAIHATFYNYGEPALHPETPNFIRAAKSYLLRTSLSTNLSLERFDAEAYVESGLDSMLLSIDGATQAVYGQFRRKGQLDLVYSNISKLVAAKRRLRRRTPILTWQYLAFEHNAHEIPMAVNSARRMGVDQFQVVTPHDVSWDSADIQPAKVTPFSLDFDSSRGHAMIENWCPYPEELAGTDIEDEFSSWPAATPIEKVSVDLREGTCHWLYKNITMDAQGRILPCCGAPKSGTDLVFSQFDSEETDHFNAPKFQLARLAFRSRDRQEDGATYCAECQWDKTHTPVDREVVRSYFRYLPARIGNPFPGPVMDLIANWVV